MYSVRGKVWISECNIEGLQCVYPVRGKVWISKCNIEGLQCVYPVRGKVWISKCNIMFLDFSFEQLVSGNDELQFIFWSTCL